MPQAVMAAVTLVATRATSATWQITRLKVGEAASLQKSPEVDETESRYISKKSQRIT